MAERAASREPFVPAVYQPPLPTDRLILKHGSPGAGDRTELDVLIVGAGPAGGGGAAGMGKIAKRGGGGGGSRGRGGGCGGPGGRLNSGRGAQTRTLAARIPPPRAWR